MDPTNPNTISRSNITNSTNDVDREIRDISIASSEPRQSPPPPPLSFLSATTTPARDDDIYGNDCGIINLAAADASSSSQLAISIGARLNHFRRAIACPSCGHCIPLHDHDQDNHGYQVAINDLPGLPAGVKFDPTDQEILEHLEAKMESEMSKIHPLIDEFIPTLDGENGICYTHPEKLPGVSKDGLIRHFFHRPSKAYTTGTRKRRKVLHNYEEDGSVAGETRWHKTGKTRPVVVNRVVKGFKKILVLYTNYGRQKKPEKTNWVMHQYHLGDSVEEKDGELAVSKVFYQTQPRHCGHNHVVIKEPHQQQLHHQQEQQQLLLLQQRQHEVKGLPAVLKSTTLIEYYHHQPFVSHHHNHHVVGSGDHHDQSRESLPHELIPNLGLQGDGSSFVSLGGGNNEQKN